MSFQSFGFLAFLPMTVAVCLLAGRRNRRAGRLLLTLASMVFYVQGGGWPAFFVLLAGSGVTAWAMRRLSVNRSPQSCRRTVWLAACWHLSVLLTFKYAGFLTGGAARLDMLPPLGLSFFTFQQLWCLKETDSGGFRLQTAADLPLYAFFFPTVTSGPILKPQAFFPQLEEARAFHPSWDDAAAGLYAICCGMGKKVLLADSFGVVVDNGWAYLEALSSPGACVVILGYTLQLYFDFSGYCDIAAGCARLLGLRLPLNFDSPYRSLSVGEFWKRWHMTLTSFLRECLYVPLGGSRKGRGRTYFNILLVFLVSGVWHGAGWTFILWGLLHGLSQVIERVWGAGRQRLPKPMQWGMTFLFVNLAWVFFRAPSLSAAWAMLSAAVSPGPGLPAAELAEGIFASEITAVETILPMLSGALPQMMLSALFVVGLTAALWPKNTARQMDVLRPALWRAAVCAGILVWAVLSISGGTTFIYSNF